MIEPYIEGKEKEKRECAQAKRTMRGLQSFPSVGFHSDHFFFNKEEVRVWR